MTPRVGSLGLIQGDVHMAGKTPGERQRRDDNIFCQLVRNPELMHTLSLVVGAVLLFPSLASGQSTRWVRLSKDTLKAGAEFLDYQTLSETPDGVSAWIRVRRGQSRDTLLGKRVASAKVHYLVDCVGKKYDLIGGVRYDAAGYVIASWEAPKELYNLTAPIPDTVGEDDMEAICQFMAYKSDPTP